MEKVTFNFKISISVDDWDVNRLEEEFFQRRNQSFREFFEEALAGIDRRLSLRPPICPFCDQQMQRKGRKPRRLETKLGTVRFWRWRYRCENCHLERFPLDEMNQA